MEVFLGGTTVEGTTWREKLISLLEIDYFNPVVDDWDEEAQELELEKRESCDFVLYVVTPLMEGFYSIAEMIDDSNKRPEETIVCFLDKDGENEDSWTEHQQKSIEAIENMVIKNGAFVLENLEEVAEFLNEVSK